MSFYRRQGPLYLASAAAIIILAEYFLATTALDPIKETLVSWSTLLTSFASLFAFSTLLISYANPWVKGRTQTSHEKVLNISFWVFFLAMAIIGIALGTGDSFAKLWHTAWYRGPLSMKWGLWAVYMVWSTYRIFKARDWGTLVFALSMMFWLTKNSPSGALIPGVDPIGTWIIQFPSLGGIRAGTIAYGLGAVVVGIRLLLTRERGLLEREVEA
jgi:hypothetical protein